MGHSPVCFQSMEQRQATRVGYWRMVRKMWVQWRAQFAERARREAAVTAGRLKARAVLAGMTGRLQESQRLAVAMRVPGRPRRRD